MIPALRFPSRSNWKRIFGLTALILCLGLSAANVYADGTMASPSGDNDFGQYLVNHQDDIAPFFTKNSADLINESVPLFLELWHRVMLFSLLGGWTVDVLLSRWFSAYFAPAFTKFRRAIIYATGRLGLSVTFIFFLSMAINFGAGLPHFMGVILFLILIFVLVELIVQTGWVFYVYRTTVPVAAGFYLGIFVMHTLAGILIAAPILGGQASSMVTSFIDKEVTPKLQVEVDAAKKEEATAEASRDQVAALVADRHKQIDLAAADQARLLKEIEDKKNSEAYLFSQIVLERAKGNFTAARDQLTDLLGKFPDGPLTDQVKMQLVDVNSDLATQEANKKLADFQAAQDAAKARADLLAKANQGQATLSDMRTALLGKTPTDVTALLGPPVETNSDVWGYSQQMIVDPLTGKKYGLTVRYSDGYVQGVAYYYGHGASSSE